MKKIIALVLINSLLGLGTVFAQKNIDKEILKEKKAIESREQNLKKDPNSYTWEEDQVLYNYLINNKKDYINAIEVGKLMIQKSESAKKPELYKIGESYANTGLAYYYANDNLSAHYFLQKSAEISEQLYGTGSLAVSNDYINLARNYKALNNERAIDLFQVAIVIKSGFLGMENDQVKELIQEKTDFENSRNKKDIPIGKDKNNTAGRDKKEVKEKNLNKFDEATINLIIDSIHRRIRNDYGMLKSRIDTVYIEQKISEEEIGKIITKLNLLNTVPTKNNVAEKKIAVPASIQPIKPQVTKAEQPVRTPTPSKEVYITIKQGQTLYGVSRENNVSVDDLVKLNNLTVRELLIGQQLRVK